MPIAERNWTGSPIEVVHGLEGVPDLVAEQGNARIKEVWLHEEFKELEKLARRAERWGKAHGVTVKYRLECGLEQCPSKAIKITPMASAPSGAVLRCGCTDRLFARH